MNTWIDTASDIMIVALIALATGGDIVMAVSPNGIVLGVV